MKGGAKRAVVFVGAVYVVVGIVFGALAGQTASHQSVVAWRWAAWMISALAFGSHIVFDQVHFRNSPRITAFHVAVAAGVGAFGLAVAANIHHVQAAPPVQRSLLLTLSLGLWPVMTALPAFFVALAAALLFARVRRLIHRT
jgi:hypothetical protein